MRKLFAIVTGLLTGAVSIAGLSGHQATEGVLLN